MRAIRFPGGRRAAIVVATTGLLLGLSGCHYHNRGHGGYGGGPGYDYGGHGYSGGYGHRGKGGYGYGRGGHHRRGHGHPHGGH